MGFYSKIGGIETTIGIQTDSDKKKKTRITTKSKLEAFYLKWFEALKTDDCQKIIDYEPQTFEWEYKKQKFIYTPDIKLSLIDFYGNKQEFFIEVKPKEFKQSKEEFLNTMKKLASFERYINNNTDIYNSFKLFSKEHAVFSEIHTFKLSYLNYKFVLLADDVFIERDGMFSQRFNQFIHPIQYLWHEPFYFKFMDGEAQTAITSKDAGVVNEYQMFLATNTFYNFKGEFFNEI